MTRVLQLVAGPNDLNVFGKVFGGWLMGQMDEAGAIIAQEFAWPLVTVAADNIRFFSPVLLGDLVAADAKLIKIGNTSISVHVKIFAKTLTQDFRLAVEGDMHYVYVDENGNKKPIKSYTV